MLLRNDGAERILGVRFLGLDVHDAPRHLARREVQPPHWPVADAEVRLAVALLAGADDDVAGIWRNLLHPGESSVANGAEAPRARFDGVAVRSEPAVDEARDVFAVSRFWK